MARPRDTGGRARHMRDAWAPVRLLLFAVLVLGTLGMHTIGHPPQAHAFVAAEAHSACPDGHCADTSTDATQGATDHGGGMDMASLCLAILLAGFALAVALLVRRHRMRRRRGSTRGLWGRLASALPPPRPPDLSRLAVLRL